MARSFLIAVEIPLTLLIQQRLSLRGGIVYLLADGSETVVIWFSSSFEFDTKLSQCLLSFIRLLPRSIYLFFIYLCSFSQYLQELELFSHYISLKEIINILKQI